MGLTSKTGGTTEALSSNARSERGRALLNAQMEERKNRKSPLRLGIWGEPKTVKSGLALDFPHKKIYVLDWDNGCEPTWRQNHLCTDRIQLFDPFVMNEKGEPNQKLSEQNSEDFILMVKDEIAKGEDILFVFDGIDRWLDVCTLLVTGSAKVGKPQKMKFEWGKRNAPFKALLSMCLKLDCDQIYITHAKGKYDGQGNLIGQEPKWNILGDALFQIIETKQTKKQGNTIYKATLSASKTNTTLVGKTWETLTVGPAGVNWTGIPELREGKV
jgi:hypothetical protein|tara:strand:- start:2834 stop:3649 length:816 start_codon:yes stop_codon:yes gene_type:complete